MAANSSVRPVASSSGIPAPRSSATNSSDDTGTYCTGRPAAALTSAIASWNVSSRGPVSSYSWPMWRSSVRAAVTTSAMSSTSRNGSATSPAGIASVPACTDSTRTPSSKFWANTAQRTMVQLAPEAFTSSSACSASSSPRPDSNTTRRAPAATACRTKASTASAPPGKAMSGA